MFISITGNNKEQFEKEQKQLLDSFESKVIAILDDKEISTIDLPKECVEVIDKNFFDLL